MTFYLKRHSIRVAQLPVYYVSYPAKNVPLNVTNVKEGSWYGHIHEAIWLFVENQLSPYCRELMNEGKAVPFLEILPQKQHGKQSLLQY